MNMTDRIVEMGKEALSRASTGKFNPPDIARKLDERDRSKQTTVQQMSARLGQLMADTGNTQEARVALERLMGGNDLVSVNYLSRGLIAARAVCRVHLKTASGNTTGYGTGSLVAPGVLMTNHHVISGIAEAQYATAEFDYELDVTGNSKTKVEFSILVNPELIADRALDFCLVGVAPKSKDSNRALDEYGWLALNPTPGKAIVGEYLTIIQHPGGERKQICVRENKLIKYDAAGDTLWYMTDTVAGSSGSPVFNNAWQVVALHHSGIPKTDSNGNWLTVDGKIWNKSMGEENVWWLANEGIRISSILSFLKSKYASHPLARKVLKGTPSPITEQYTQSNSGASQSSRFEDGELRITIPVEIGVRVGERLPAIRTTTSNTDDDIASSDQPDLMGASTGVPSGVERVDVDQSNYRQRPGYDPKFLGRGKLEIPLPTYAGAKSRILTFKEGRATVSELRYWNYSVLMNKQRKLAFYSAVNVDANQRPQSGGREGDRWYFDARIAETYQIGQDFYGSQSTFEAQRDRNPFDRGHLTRRLDAQWGTDSDVAKRSGDDSFHWTNCSPQHFKFNQGAKKWLGLEDYVIKTFAKSSGRACVINGPVFDAPLSAADESGRLVPKPNGKSHKDPTFGGVSIPKLFFKIVAIESEEGALSAASFLMSQEDFLQSIDRLKGMPPNAAEILSTAEAEIYQVPISDIETLAKLDFGVLKDVDTNTFESTACIPRLITMASEIQL